MIIETRAADPFFKNGFVIGCEDTREGVVIDPGDEVGELLAAVEQHKLTIRYILLTHAHLDHMTGVAAAKQALGVPVGLHRDDNFLYDGGRSAGADVRVARRAAAEGGLLLRRPGPWRFGNYGAWVHHTPGHCPGGVCLAIGRDGEAERTLIVGDTLFAGSIGRTDLPGGDIRRCCVDSRGPVRVPGRHGRLSGPRRADDDRPREADESVSAGIVNQRATVEERT